MIGAKFRGTEDVDERQVTSGIAQSPNGENLNQVIADTHVRLVMAIAKYRNKTET